ncbi:hypothetical protein [Pseudoxanthomonas daejeonensis]|uniref:Uncharacterized protein n=1 Tax=Pseudoxanthomonas daejeonensis TaxID=266062 RepID=A0ABQ6Z7K6_9GAMM|nr:hypothetical protein [Pseudoxanthomonas daejeonensis]KAF1695033.1 hypothetical protein CSC65_07395 [Pseudoxanthomonas daejeonensis]
MPITLATPPEAAAAELGERLPPLARSAALEARAPAIGRAAGRFELKGNMRVARSLAEVADADVVASPVYALGLDQLAKGKLGDGARLTAWSWVIATEAGAVSAETLAETNRFAQITNAASAGRFRRALLDMAAGNADADGEAVQLRIPALHTSLLWIKGRREVYEVLDTSVAGLQTGRRYTAAELLKVLKPEAESRLRNDTLDG